ncbi:hypothetical protein K450DRAFT_245466 [Umbelopsis ramanniana AG]|uniref:Heparan-alpha-glucosaminide N-acetyltransferase catalytic domain-containing protein n=1 Tax=Umbelopsis ramanniana AG TaxID=1314678 RepID=A0AAD5HDQ5_UMBRA|nr:uncharacterized protein K450DRAFT_245466 [Umbelopsis ramanniana AG]KAI8578776.1 hypothetical protein K450DRAFT_245466 [Umbelopsis ramanniana AG]
MDTTRLLSSQKPTNYDAVAVRIGDSLPAVRPQRVVALDLLRGLLMVLQSIDHAKAAFTTWYGPHECWYELPSYDEAWQFILRLMTHPCAPGFAMLMGIGVTYFVRSRKALEWSDGKLLWHFFVRGSVLVLINLFQSWGMGKSFGNDQIHFATTVLHALGVNFFSSAVILIASNHLYSLIKRSLSRRDEINIDATSKADKRANDIRILIIFELAAAFMILNLFIVPAVSAKDGVIEGYGWWRYFVYLPGLASFFISLYPAVNWLGLTLYGVGFGLLMIRDKRDNRQNAKFNTLFALGWFIFFLIIRFIGGFGNINPFLVGESGVATAAGNPFLTNWITFFNTIKYPPDLAYTALFLTVNHLLLTAFFLVPTGPDANKYVSAIITNGPLLDFGRSALFFYVLHFYLYFGSAGLIGMLFPDLKSPKGTLAMNGWQFFITWSIGLIILWVLCKRYARFKASRGPDSIFRFF